VKIEWKIDQASEKLSLSWIETGDPLVNPPSRRSFGTRMMESLGQQLSGTVRLAHPPSGFTCTLDILVRSL
jgi:two-component sensor histidine kinase